MPGMGDDQPEQRLDDSLRLKAARMLHGHTNAQGQAVALPIRELVEIPALRENGLSKNRLEEIEQMKSKARPWELRAISKALALPGWFGAAELDEGDEHPVSLPLADVLQALQSDARARRRAREAGPASSDEEDRPEQVGGGGAV